MKLLFVYRFCGLGGVETSILNKLEALNAEGIDGHALFGEFYGSGGSTLATDSRVSVGLDKTQIAALIRSGFDAIAVIDYPDFLDLLDELRPTAHILFETHASLPPALPRLYSKLNHPLIAAIVVPSHFNKRLVESTLDSRKDVVVIPNPVEGTQFFPHVSNTLTNFPQAPGGPILLWVGRLEDEKNPIEFMKIAQQLLTSQPGLRFIVVGDAFSTEEYVAYQERMRAQVATHWTNRFTFCRTVPYQQMPQVYSLAAQTGGCLVSTSRFESAPMTFVEAMMCNCPVVSSDVGGAGELVTHGTTGFLYTLGDTSGAAAVITQLIDSRQLVHRRAIVESARAKVAARHSPGAFAYAYKKLLDSLPALHQNPCAERVGELRASAGHGRER